VDRRDFLKASATLTLAGCAAPMRAFVPDTSRSTACGLAPVLVSATREIRTVVGLRPFRPSGFVVRAEKLGETLVVHNYGHGGGGITLSWGTAKLAVDIGAQGYVGPVAVLGCGAVGLATARLLQESGFAVTIYTKDLPPNTTSNIAGGQWRPVSVHDRGKGSAAFKEQLGPASTFAHTRYQSLVGARYGVRWMRNYFLSDEPFSEPELPVSEHPFRGYRHVRQLDTMLIEPPIYLDALLDEVRLAGAKVVVRAMPDRAAIVALPEKLVFNCTGLGAKALFDDDELVPVKGQLTILVPQPEVQYAVCSDDLYMFSRGDGVLLGGTFERGEWSLEPNAEAKQRIIAAHKTLFDSFAC
jgi:D-amino-acid oxidase